MAYSKWDHSSKSSANSNSQSESCSDSCSGRRARPVTHAGSGCFSRRCLILLLVSALLVCGIAGVVFFSYVLCCKGGKETRSVAGSATAEKEAEIEVQKMALKLQKVRKVKFNNFVRSFVKGIEKYTGYKLDEIIKH